LGFLVFLVFGLGFLFLGFVWWGANEFWVWKVFGSKWVLNLDWQAFFTFIKLVFLQIFVCFLVFF